MFPQSKTSARIYPTYHTAFDTFGYVDKFVDPGEDRCKGILRPEEGGLKTEPGLVAPPLPRPAGFSSHQAVARTAGNVLLRLSDSLFLPLNVSDYSETLRSFLQAAQRDLGALLEQHNISLGTEAPDLEAQGDLHSQG